MIDDLTDVSPGTPEWIEPSFVFKARADPPGIQTITQDRVIGRLLPGILALSERARYFSFYSFLVRRYEDLRRTPANRALLNYVRARDYEYALAVRLCPNRCGSSPVRATAAGRALSGHPAAYERGESVESNGGGYGLYYGSQMRISSRSRQPAPCWAMSPSLSMWSAGPDVVSPSRTPSGRRWPTRGT